VAGCLLWGSIAVFDSADLDEIVLYLILVVVFFVSGLLRVVEGPVTKRSRSCCGSTLFACETLFHQYFSDAPEDQIAVPINDETTPKRIIPLILSLNWSFATPYILLQFNQW
jgi:hypothetical protein